MDFELINNDNYIITNLCIGRSGKVVQLSGSVNPQKSSAPWTRIISGAPAPINTGSNIFTTLKEIGCEPTADIKLYVSTANGEIFIRGGAAYMVIDFSFCYIAK